jgi:hypothetical protein
VPNKNTDWIGYRFRNKICVINYTGKNDFLDLKEIGVKEMTKKFTASGENVAMDIALARLGNLKV